MENNHKGWEAVKKALWISKWRELQRSHELPMFDWQIAFIESERISAAKEERDRIEALGKKFYIKALRGDYPIQSDAVADFLTAITKDSSK